MASHGILTYDDVANGIRNTIQDARISRTRAYFEHRAEFMALLVVEISKAIRKAKAQGFIPVFRLNGTSDIRWELVPVGAAPNIMALFPDVQFYDYTKLANRKHVPANYHLTFSLADGNNAAASAAIANGLNVAAVFRDKATVARYMDLGITLGAHVPVMRGDDTDLRFLDATGHVVALYAKGNAKKSNGFREGLTMKYSEAAGRLRDALDANAPIERDDVSETLEDFAALEDAYTRTLAAGEKLPKEPCPYCGKVRE